MQRLASLQKKATSLPSIGFTGEMLTHLCAERLRKGKFGSAIIWCFSELLKRGKAGESDRLARQWQIPGTGSSSNDE